MRLDTRATPVIALLGVVLGLLGLSACGDDDPRPNQRPTIVLTAGPMTGDSTAWNATFHWLGTDPDGEVDHYQYALDPSPDAVGSADDPGSTAIAWRDTTSLEAQFFFETPTPDSAYGSDGTPGPPSRYTGQHVVVVRAVDDDGLASLAAYVEFTALNLAPRTTLNDGAYLQADLVPYARVCPTTLWWTSIDPETPGGSSPEIAGYEYKLRQMPIAWVPNGRSSSTLTSELAVVPWMPIPADSTELNLTLQTGFAYIAAVRAVDRGGAREEVLVKGRNMIVIESSAFAGLVVELEVRERIVGTIVGPGPVFEAEIASGTELRFEMTLDGSAYGVPTSEYVYNYGIDVDPDSDDSGPGWAGWSRDRLTDIIRLVEPGIHTLVFRTQSERACRRGITTVYLVLHVIPMPLDRAMLYVDDFRRAGPNSSSGLTDAAHDLRNRQMLAAAGIDVNDPSQFVQFNTFGSGDLQGDPTYLRLSDLAPFRMVYWDVLGSGLARNPGLVGANACATGRILQAYVAAGGALWVSGQSVFAGFDVASGTECLANFAYEFNTGGSGLNFSAGDFPCDFMQLCGGGIMSVRTAASTHGLLQATPSSAGGAAGLPTLEIDPSVFAGEAILFTDVMTTPVFGTSGGLDSLYTHRPPVSTSPLNGKPNAFRYHDPDPVPSQGPVAIFGFPLFYLQQGSVAQGTGTFKTAQVMIDWMRSEQQRFVETRTP